MNWHRHEVKMLAELLQSQERVHPISLMPPMAVRRIEGLLCDAGLVQAGDGTWIPTSASADWLERITFSDL